MISLTEIAQTHPKRELAPGETLIAQGEDGGDLFILDSGELSVERDGIAIATIARHGAIIGEMSVVLGTAASATVKATIPTTVRVIRDAQDQLQRDPALSFRLAHLMATRLDTTSALLVDLTRQNKGRTEQGLLGRIFSALHLGSEEHAVGRSDMFGDGQDASRE